MEWNDSTGTAYRLQGDLDYTIFWGNVPGPKATDWRKAAITTLGTQKLLQTLVHGKNHTRQPGQCRQRSLLPGFKLHDANCINTQTQALLLALALSMLV